MNIHVQYSVYLFFNTAILVHNKRQAKNWIVLNVQKSTRTEILYVFIEDILQTKENDEVTVKLQML